MDILSSVFSILSALSRLSGYDGSTDLLSSLLS